MILFITYISLIIISFLSCIYLTRKIDNADVTVKLLLLFIPFSVIPFIQFIPPILLFTKIVKIYRILDKVIIPKPKSQSPTDS